MIHHLSAALCGARDDEPNRVWSMNVSEHGLPSQIKRFSIPSLSHLRVRSIKIRDCMSHISSSDSKD